MPRRAKTAAIAVVAAGALAIGATAVATGSHSNGGKSPQKAPERSYQITVENLTGGQPISPPLLVAHNRRADLWERGTIANHAVAAIAEDANNAVALEVAGKIRGVGAGATGVDVNATDPAPIGPGGKQTYSLDVKGYYGKLTVLAMLVNSNDAFTGLDSVRLPRQVGKTRSHYRIAYDAGSEKNNEGAKYIPGPVGGNPFVRDPEGDVIRAHPGVKGGADLDPKVHSLSGKVAKITVTRVR
jgi:hypothetical protein